MIATITFLDGSYIVVHEDDLDLDEKIEDLYGDLEGFAYELMTPKKEDKFSKNSQASPFFGIKTRHGTRFFTRKSVLYVDLLDEED